LRSCLFAAFVVLNSHGSHDITFGRFAVNGRVEMNKIGHDRVEGELPPLLGLEIALNDSIR
jgi:hypothetical protein